MAQPMPDILFTTPACSSLWGYQAPRPGGITRMPGSHPQQEAEAPGPDQAKDPQRIPTPALYAEQKCCQPSLPPNEPPERTGHQLCLQI